MGYIEVKAETRTSSKLTIYVYPTAKSRDDEPHVALSGKNKQDTYGITVPKGDWTVYWTAAGTPKKAEYYLELLKPGAKSILKGATSPYTKTISKTGKSKYYWQIIVP